MRFLVAAFAVTFAGASLCPAQSSAPEPKAAKVLKPAPSRNSPPDIIFFNGTIYTGEGLRNDNPQAVEAMAIGAGKVLSAGSNEHVKRLAGPKTGCAI